jgi:hypothetical protein
MKKSKYNEEQIIGVLKRMEAGQKARELARKLDDRSLNNYTMNVSSILHFGKGIPH